MMPNVLLAFLAAAAPSVDDFRDLSVVTPTSICQLCVLLVASRVMAFLIYKISEYFSNISK